MLLQIDADCYNEFAVSWRVFQLDNYKCLQSVNLWHCRLDYRSSSRMPVWAANRLQASVWRSFPAFGPRKTLAPWNPESAVDTMGPEVADGDRKKSGPSFASNGRFPGGARTFAISTRRHRRFQWRGQAGPVGGTIPHAEGRIVRNQRYKYCVDDHANAESRWWIWSVVLRKRSTRLAIRGIQRAAATSPDAGRMARRGQNEIAKINGVK